MICEKCGKEFNEDWRRDPGTRKTPCRFCSRRCANSKVQTKEINEKRSKTLTRLNKRYCSSCGRIISHRNKTGICIFCRPVGKTGYEHLKTFRRKRKEILVEYKGSKCEICGYNKCIASLEFHHLDPNEKDFTIGSSNNRLNRTLETDKKEADKCILLCSNCHREIHFKKES